MERCAVRQGRYPSSMAPQHSGPQRSLTDVLVVIIMMSVLCGVRVPRYLHLRPVIKARDCKEQIEALARSNAAFVLHDVGSFTRPNWLTLVPRRPSVAFWPGWRVTGPPHLPTGWHPL